MWGASCEGRDPSAHTNPANESDGAENETPRLMEGVFLIRLASWWADLHRQGTWNWRPENKVANNGLESGLLTYEKPPGRPLSPTYPILSSPPSPASQQPRGRHVNLAPFERATGSGENKSAEVHGEFSQATARGFLSLWNCCCLCQRIPLFSNAVSLPSSLLATFPLNRHHIFW